MKNYKMYKGRKVPLTVKEEAEKANRDAQPPEVSRPYVDPFQEMVLDELAELTGKTKEQLKDSVEAKRTASR